LQVFCPVQVSASSVNLATGAHAPSEPGTAHDWHVPHAELEQQTPSTQLPDAQSPSVSHAVPSALRQMPAASQIESPSQVSSCVPVTGEHTPTFPVSAQLVHEPSHAVSQQTPSAQWPLSHCSSLVHANARADLGAVGTSSLVSTTAWLSALRTSVAPASASEETGGAWPSSDDPPAASPHPATRAATSSSARPIVE
jgi:hypothetical protein